MWRRYTEKEVAAHA
ncbi:uncharacterized protein CELE_Y38F2AL.12 [Caenorhabditis elegans]|uniref:Uncharacterized protein n=1 Tax=Caenorhabditis elegans TaxID=6239 RepID=I2HAE6_CAEEL|nr:Uncharacterized protein CELE_Y38F2AL.12 [Caenorhabditis elegans]CCH63853.1 Uncharacterized protein CELE_Y38F2AL.12 [Caenorhabditis elegans]|eukprot:NP_001255238.1 Uncharacterized protein CELE_Y38F2AL.12 [Caenorhabditis elegans]